MLDWKNASCGDLKRREIIEYLLESHPKLLDYLFHEDIAELRASPAVIRRSAGFYSSGERILIRAALDIWSESGDVKLLDLLSLDFKNYERVINAFTKIR